MCARIAIDIDDTLYSFTDLARKIMTKIGFESGDKQMIAAAYAAWPEWRAPTDLLGFDRWMDIIDMCHDDDMILAQQPYLGAAETCRALMGFGHELLYISNRATETEDPTQEWLFSNGFVNNVDNCNLICLNGDKTKSLSECQYIIDDRPKNLIQFVYDFEWTNKYGSTNIYMQRKAFGLTAPYNRALTDVPGIYLAPTWHGLNYYLQSKELLAEQVEVGV